MTTTQTTPATAADLGDQLDVDVDDYVVGSPWPPEQVVHHRRCPDSNDLPPLRDLPVTDRLVQQPRQPSQPLRVDRTCLDADDDLDRLVGAYNHHSVRATVDMLRDADRDADQWARTAPRRQPELWIDSVFLTLRTWLRYLEDHTDVTEITQPHGQLEQSLQRAALLRLLVLANAEHRGPPHPLIRRVADWVATQPATLPQLLAIGDSGSVPSTLPQLTTSGPIAVFDRGVAALDDGTRWYVALSGRNYLTGYAVALKSARSRRDDLHANRCVVTVPSVIAAHLRYVRSPDRTVLARVDPDEPDDLVADLATQVLAQRPRTTTPDVATDSPDCLVDVARAMR